VVLWHGASRRSDPQLVERSRAEARAILYNGDTFDHFPRRTSFHWDSINLKGVSVTYNIEIDAFGAISAGKWAAEVGKTMFLSGALTDNNYEQLFVGAQTGRWRVRAKVGGLLCPWSDWSYFKFTV